MAGRREHREGRCIPAAVICMDMYRYGEVCSIKGEGGLE